MEILHNIDISVFYFINQTCKNTVCDLILPWITNLGRPEFILGLAIVFLFFRKKEVRTLGILLLAGLTISYYSVYWIKNLVARPRPFMALKNVNLLINITGHSFPSGHATLSFLSATLLTGCFKRWYIFYTIALVVALSRSYLGVHYPSDILTGAILGSLLGYILIRVARGANLMKNRGQK
ncbi:MAG: phosphatase PAP2 family protein [Candidatus Omnitrophota bacterium]